MGTDNSWTLTLAVLRASTAIVDAVQEAVAAAGHTDLRPAHGMVFVHVAAGEATVVTVAEFLGVSKQAASVLVQYLVDHGYLERVSSPRDGRVRILVLTAAGRDCTAVAGAAAARLTAEWREQLGPAEFDVLAQGLAGLTAGAAIRPAW
ncbi:MarR family transcriptional regulator [Nakamurella silvestris]|nr:MarR family transcriptional regulator [Nakamurella silvestris]